MVYSNEDTFKSVRGHRQVMIGPMLLLVGFPNSLAIAIESRSDRVQQGERHA